MARSWDSGITPYAIAGLAAVGAAAAFVLLRNPSGSGEIISASKLFTVDTGSCLSLSQQLQQVTLYYTSLPLQVDGTTNFKNGRVDGPNVVATGIIKASPIGRNGPVFQGSGTSACNATTCCDCDWTFMLELDPMFAGYVMPANVVGCNAIGPNTIHCEIPPEYQQCAITAADQVPGCCPNVNGTYPATAGPIACPDASWVGKRVLVAGDYALDKGHCCCQTSTGGLGNDSQCAGATTYYGHWSEIHPVRLLQLL